MASGPILNESQKYSASHFGAFKAHTKGGQFTGVSDFVDDKLKPNAFKSIEKGPSQSDEYEAEWIPSQIKGWVKTADLTENQQEVWSEGAKLFGERCGSCHQAHPSDEFTINQWPNIVKAMKDRAGLLPEQQWQLTKYMQAHAKDAK